MFKLGFFRSAQHWPSFTLSQVGCSLDPWVPSFLVPGVPTAIKDFWKLQRVDTGSISPVCWDFVLVIGRSFSKMHLLGELTCYNWWIGSTNKYGNFLGRGNWAKWSALLTKNMLPAGVLFINLAMHHIANYFLIFGCFVIFSFLLLAEIERKKYLLYGPKKDWYSLLGNRMWLWKKGKLRAQNSVFLNHLHSYGSLRHWTSFFWKCWKLFFCFWKAESEEYVYRVGMLDIFCIIFTFLLHFFSAFYVNMFCLWHLDSEGGI